MRTTKQIADDCGLDRVQESLLTGLLDSPDNLDTHLGLLESIIGALYRRIEKLEEEK